MKRLLFAAALLLCGFTAMQSEAQASPIRIGVGVGVNGVGVGAGFGIARNGINLNIGTVGFNQRYVVAGQAWVNEPYFYWVNIPDPRTGRVVPVRRVGYTRRLVVLYLDTWQGGYGYFDRWGNPVPYNNRFPW